MKTSLKIQPVLTKKAPKYPDKYSVALDKMLLDNTPARWNTPLAKSITGTALSFSIMATLAGCAASDAGESVTPTSEHKDEIERVVPLFEHGSGIGSIGCVSVAVVRFLSEAEAMQIITDEFTQHGLTAIKSSRVIDNISLPMVYAYNSALAEEQGTTDSFGSLSLDLDLVGTNVVMEYVSWEDYQRFPKGTKEPEDILASGHQIKPAAQLLTAAFEQLEDTNTTYATFYDPAHIQDGTDRESAKAASTELLREQVRDFIEWLAAQGVI